MSVMRGRPSVSVPVLSKASAVSEPRFSGGPPPLTRTPPRAARATPERTARSEEHTSELQSLMRISYAVFCLKKKKNENKNTIIARKQHTRSQQIHSHTQSI